MKAKVKKLIELYSIPELMKKFSVCEDTIKRWAKGENAPHKLYQEKIDKLYERNFGGK